MGTCSTPGPGSKESAAGDRRLVVSAPIVERLKLPQGYTPEPMGPVSLRGKAERKTLSSLLSAGAARIHAQQCHIGALTFGF